MQKSEPYLARHCAATLATCATASGSSELTCTMGELRLTRATSVQYGDEREKRGSVVKPICKNENETVEAGRQPRDMFEEQSKQKRM